jgi:hypothetical protein
VFAAVSAEKAGEAADTETTAPQKIQSEGGESAR